VAHPDLHLADDPLDRHGIGTVPFDGEGARARRNDIISGGTLQKWLFDARDGARHGQPSTGSAVRDGFKTQPGTGTHHLVLQGPARPEAQLVADIEHGFLVDSVLGAHTANATTGDFSVTAANVWHIRNGAVAGASREVAIGGNLPELLARLDAVSSEAKAMDGARMPSVRLRDVQVSV